MILMLRLHLTASGSRWTVMAVAGDRRQWRMTRPGNLIVTVVIGFIPITAGIGIRIIRGELRFIMDAGSTRRNTAGAGGRTLFGRRRG